MNFGIVELDAEQLAFVEEVRALLTEHWVPDPHAVSLDHERPPRELLELLAERGWVHPRAPKEQGGAGLGPVEERLLALLFDDHRVPACGNGLFLPTVYEYGTDELKATVLPDLESGRATFCIGYTEPDSGSDVAAARTRAVRTEDGWLVNGSKMFTTYAQDADYCFLLARTGAIEDKHGGLTMFVVPMRSAGVEVRPVLGMGGIRTNVTYYRDVRLPDWCRLGEVGEGWKVLAGPLAEEHGLSGADPLAELNGSMGATFTRILERMVEYAVDWALAPAAGTGEAPIDDPLVRDVLTAALQDVEVCRSTPSSYGKVLAAATLQRQADTLLDLTSPAGLLDRGAPGAIAHGVLAWARLFAPATDVYGGTSEIYRNNLARGQLGLPRPR